MARSHFLCRILLLSAVVVCCRANSLRSTTPRTYLSTAWAYLFGAPAAAPKWPLKTEGYVMVTDSIFSSEEGFSLLAGFTIISTKEHGTLRMDGSFDTKSENTLKGDYFKDGKTYRFNAAVKVCLPETTTIEPGPSGMPFEFIAEDFDACAEQPKEYDCFKYNKENGTVGEITFAFTVYFRKGTSKLDHMVGSVTTNGKTFDTKLPVSYFSPEAPELPQQLLEAVKPCSVEKSDAGVQGPWKSAFKSDEGDEVSVQSDIIDGQRKIRYDMKTAEGKGSQVKRGILVVDKSGDLLPTESWSYGLYSSSFSHCSNAYSSVVMPGFDAAFHRHDELPLLREAEGKKEYGYDKFMKAWDGPISQYTDLMFTQELSKVGSKGISVVYDSETMNPVELKTICTQEELWNNIPCTEKSFVATEFVREAPDASVFDVPSEWNCNPPSAETTSSAGKRHRKPFGITVDLG